MKIFHQVFVFAFVFTMLTLISISTYSQSPPTESLGLDSKWSGGEHVDLADRGFIQACNEFSFSITNPCQNLRIPRKDQKMHLTYGQISAMGDFYDNPHASFYETGDIQFNNDNLENVFHCIDKQGKVLHEQKTKPDIEMPNCDWTYISNSKNYLEIILNNVSHFAWHNMKTYVKAHSLALQYALTAHEHLTNGRPKLAKTALNHALYINGYADHFLTDAFSAGHVRIPRKQLKKWAKKNLNGILKEIRGDILSMILHDFDGKDMHHQEIGLLVKNSRGNLWVTHSDAKLHEGTQNSEPGIAIPTEAVQLSVTEIFEAYQQGTLPESTYAATELVPFSYGQSISDTYNKMSNIVGITNLANKIGSTLPGVLRIFVTSKDIVKLIQGLPKIMKKFAQNVRKDLKRSEELNLRLPKDYRKAYSKIN